MPSIETILRKDIFNISNSFEFEKRAIDIFRFQYENNKIYREYVDLLMIDKNKIDSLNKIPFLPIEFFKTKKIISGNGEIDKVFQSSGTTLTGRSKHYVSDIRLYDESFTKAFEYFYGNPEEYCFIALLPSYLETGDSSLVYMMEALINKSKNSLSGFYLDNYEKLEDTLRIINENKFKTLLIGVSYALLELTERINIKLKDNFIVMETGGMKGRRKEITREELHKILCNGLGIKQIHSEYGMTELLSQTYSKKNGKFLCPPWMKVLIRDINDPFEILNINKTGGINIIDFANLYSCSYIATQDLGRILKDNSFEVMGRFDNSEARGCNLLISL